jgi:epoxyqueuosine reductase QueG
LERDFQPRDGHAWLDLEWVLKTEDAALEAALVGSPLRRPKAWGLKRNSLVVLGNLGAPEGVRLAQMALSHPHPVVQAQAAQTLEVLNCG